ncbi:HNH endonuclease [Roseitalea porphyridii]|uniref:Putative HNH nuclease YajD n=1 Tax=Roseitalea porphyridii TaxID=1852022 RepID=A0A4P6V056_9HYPH|nr:HNH endonuclease [Roseitalea porphyridii]QBK30777.1 HNH endonuclease [Roseitalea porphyridii]
MTRNSRNQRSPEAEAYRKLYKTKRWAELRWSVLTRDGFTCQRCGKLEAKTSNLVADHKSPHKGDLALFWDAGNIECLCRACHTGHKQSIERGGRGRPIFGTDGWPID